MAEAEARAAWEKQSWKATRGVTGMQMMKALLVKWQLRQVR
jgi:hypothetical protein